MNVLPYIWYKKRENNFLCFLECRDGFYNSSCGAHCGQCLNREICNKVNGTCPSGCNPNFQSPLCQGNSSNLVLITHFQGEKFIFRRLSVKEETIKVELNFQTGKTILLFWEERWDILVLEWLAKCSQIEVLWFNIVLMIGSTV